MTKPELVETFARAHRFTKRDAAALIENVFALAAHSMKQSGRFYWPGFGVFAVKQRKARIAVVPNTRVVMRVPPRKAVVFRAAKGLKGFL